MTDRITMAQVAARAGVHPTTVSLALRNHPSIPPSTRDRLRALAEEMGYRPDPALNALTVYRHAKSPRREPPPLAYLTHWDTECGWKQTHAHASFHAGANARATSLGFRLEHFWLGETGMSPRRLSDILIARGITGIIVSSHLPDHDHPLQLDWSRFSAVKIDCMPREPDLHHVTNDQRAIAQLAVRRSLAAGYRRIGMVIPYWWDDFVDLAWSAGFLAEQQRLPAEDRIPILFYSDPNTSAAVATGGDSLVPTRDFNDWYRRHRPEVILSKEQFVRPRLAELGISVPRDVAYVELYLKPDGTTAGVRNNCDRVGALAVETLVGLMQQNSSGIPEFPTASLVEGTWFDGATLPLRAPHGGGPNAEG